MTTEHLGRQSRREFIALQAAITAILAVATDMMLPAFGAIGDHFELDAPNNVALIVTFFFAGLGIGQYVYGPLSDRFGRKRILLVGIGIYTAAALSSALAPSFEWILVSRFVWGLGAAGPRAVSQAIIRDRFDGDNMTKVLSIVFAIFMIAPTVGPLIGQAALQLGSWRYTFGMGFIIASVVGTWTVLRLDESLPDDRRRPLNAGAIVGATLETLRTRSAVGNLTAFAFTMGMLISYLGSIQPLFDDFYGEGDRFPIWFAFGAITSGIAAMTVSRTVERFGTRRMVLVGLGIYWTLALVFFGGTLAADGVPGFWFFLVMTTLLIGAHAGSVPLLNSLAMQDVAHIAGTAAATIGTASFVVGSLLATQVTGRIESTITPFAAGYVVLIGLALVTAWFANPVRAATSNR